MKRTTVALGLLGAALVITNAWWAYRSLDFGITHTYLRASYDANTELMRQSLAVLDVVSKRNFKKDDVIRAAGAQTTAAPFEKDGYVWVGWLGLKFDGQGELTAVKSGASQGK